MTNEIKFEKTPEDEIRFTLKMHVLGSMDGDLPIEAVMDVIMGAVHKYVKPYKDKADKWDVLDEKIGKYYEDVDDDGNELEPEEDGDLLSIGEDAAIAFGYVTNIL